MPKKIEINVFEQRLRAFEHRSSGWELIHEFRCLSGAPGALTNCGDFRIEAKYPSYTSREFDVELPHAMFFNTILGEAIHEGVLSGRGSHGCVRLSRADATTLYIWTPLFTRVVVENRSVEGLRRRGRCET